MPAIQISRWQKPYHAWISGKRNIIHEAGLAIQEPAGSWAEGLVFVYGGRGGGVRR